VASVQVTNRNSADAADLALGAAALIRAVCTYRTSARAGAGLALAIHDALRLEIARVVTLRAVLAIHLAARSARARELAVAALLAGEHARAILRAREIADLSVATRAVVPAVAVRRTDRSVQLRASGAGGRGGRRRGKAAARGVSRARRRHARAGIALG